VQIRPLERRASLSSIDEGPLKQAFGDLLRVHIRHHDTGVIATPKYRQALRALPIFSAC